jgi:SH3-like domain-containing protein
MTVPRLTALLLLLLVAPAIAATDHPPPNKSPDKAAPAEDRGTVTGLPLPRWAALRSDEVNLRVGPGMRYPIEWQYHRRNLPVKILRELDVWRLIEDEDGIKGWVHQATLVGHRSFVVKGAPAVLRRAPRDDAAPVARLEPGVVGRIRACAAGATWCEVQVGDYRGFLRRDQFFGSFPGEAVN